MLLEIEHGNLAATTVTVSQTRPTPRVPPRRRSCPPRGLRAHRRSPAPARRRELCGRAGSGRTAAVIAPKPRSRTATEAQPRVERCEHVVLADREDRLADGADALALLPGRPAASSSRYLLAPTRYHRVWPGTPVREALPRRCGALVHGTTSTLVFIVWAARPNTPPFDGPGRREWRKRIETVLCALSIGKGPGQSTVLRADLGSFA